MESLGQNGKILSIYEIGAIEYKVKGLLQITSVLDRLIGVYAENIKYEKKTCSVKTLKPFSISEMTNGISMALINSIGDIKPEVIKLILDLGYTDAENIYNLILSRVSMFYTILRIGEYDYNIIII